MPNHTFQIPIFGGPRVPDRKNLPPFNLSQSPQRIRRVIRNRNDDPFLRSKVGKWSRFINNAVDRIPINLRKLGVNRVRLRGLEAEQNRRVAAGGGVVAEEEQGGDCGD